MSRVARLAPVLVAFACACACACDDDDASSAAGPSLKTAAPAPTPSEKPEPQEAQDPDPLEGLDEVADDEAATSAPGPGGALGGVVRGATGPCAPRGSPRIVWPRPGPVALLAFGRAFVVAGYARGEGGGEELFAVRVPRDGAPTPLGRFPVSPPLGRARPSAPGLGEGKPGHVLVALVDGEGQVRVGAVDGNRPGAPVSWAEVGGDADVRFAPAVFRVGDHVVAAYTDGSETPMRVRMARMARLEVVSRHVLNAEAMGAAAPTPVRGASPPALLFLDPRAAVSPLLRVDLRADATPRPAVVGRPLSNVTEPPQIAAALSSRGVEVGYTAVGNGATTAVGWVPFADEAAPPRALVPGTGYGTLHVSAAAVAEGVLFAASVPTGKDRTASREVRLFHAKGGALAPPIVIAVPGGSASQPAVAASSTGAAAVAYSTPDGVSLALVDCDAG